MVRILFDKEFKLSLNTCVLTFRKENLKTMASRTNSMRQLLYQKLNILGTPGNWDHIVKSVGLFCFTGLNGNLNLLLIFNSISILINFLQNVNVPT